MQMMKKLAPPNTRITPAICNFPHCFKPFCDVVQRHDILVSTSSLSALFGFLAC